MALTSGSVALKSVISVPIGWFSKKLAEVEDVAYNPDARIQVLLREERDGGGDLRQIPAEPEEG